MKKLKEWWSNRSKTQKVLIIVGGVFLLAVGNSVKKNKPDACECVSILSVPTKRVGNGIFPLVDQNNEDFAKWTKCHVEYYGFATALTECRNKDD